MIEHSNMQLSVRRFDKEDHKILTKWWEDWDFPVITLEMLPFYGSIVSDLETGQDICAAFCYLTDSTYALFEWCVCNKDYRNKGRKNSAFQVLFEDIEQYAKSQGRRVLNSYVSNRELCFHRRFENAGYKKGDINMINYYKII